MNSEFRNPWIGSLPKIGIRPAIDGRRRGVRESLDGQVMKMARLAATFLSENLRYPNGQPVECVIADTCIGGVAEAAACAEKFRREGVGVSLTVTPCWCYGSETMDMDPLMPKAVWGFNGTERPGAVYLAAVLAGHNQKGLPAFGIYGRDVQDAGDTDIPADVQEKLLRFARAGLAAATMRGKSYLSVGGVSMGIAGSIVDQSFFEDYLGMRVESVDMTELVRRIGREHLRRGRIQARPGLGEKTLPRRQGPQRARQPAQRRAKGLEWETVVKMTMIVRDLMVGNPRLGELGFGEEALGHNAIAGGFQGQRAVDRPLPQRRFHRGDAQLLLRLERHPPADHPGHGKRQPQRRMHALWPSADQHGADLRRRAHLLEPRSGQARHRPHSPGRPPAA